MVKEKAAVDWETDTTHEEWIPEHRIQYFKRYLEIEKSIVMWDRETKRDLVFGSGIPTLETLVSTSGPEQVVDEDSEEIFDIEDSVKYMQT